MIGERKDERDRLQKLRIDVELEISDAAGETDQLADTVDYAALTEKIRAALVAAKCKMIERAAKVVCDVCLADEKVASAKVTVTKSGAVPHLESASATAEYASSKGGAAAKGDATFLSREYKGKSTMKKLLVSTAY